MQINFKKGRAYIALALVIPEFQLVDRAHKAILSLLSSQGMAGSIRHSHGVWLFTPEKPCEVNGHERKVGALDVELQVKISQCSKLLLQGVDGVLVIAPTPKYSNLIDLKLSQLDQV